MNLSNFEATDKINSIHDITDEKMKELVQNFKITQQQDHISVYCLENNPDAIPQITYCNKIEQYLCVKLYHKGTSISLHVWFRKRRNTHLASWSMVPNLIVYAKQKAKEDKSLLDELKSLKFKKRPHYSSHAHCKIRAWTEVHISASLQTSAARVQPTLGIFLQESYVWWVAIRN